MDLQLLWRVLWRHRAIVTIGLVLVVLLSAFSMVRYSNGHVAYRQHEKWETTSKILVTQAGFPEGRVAVGDTSDRFVQLAFLYASFIDADSVRRLISPKELPTGEGVSANAIVVQGSGAALPIVDVTGVAATPVRSAALTARATDALLEYIQRQQALAGIRDANRVVVQLIQSPSEPQLVQSRPVTLPIMVFLAGMSLLLGFVFVLDNMRRPRGRAAGELPVQTTTPVPAAVAAVTDEVSSGRRWRVESDAGDETPEWSPPLTKRQTN